MAIVVLAEPDAAPLQLWNVQPGAAIAVIETVSPKVCVPLPGVTVP